MESESLELRLATCMCFETIASGTRKETDKAYPVTPFSENQAVRLKEFACTALAILISEQQDPDAYYQDALDFLLPCALSSEPRVREKAIWALGSIILLKSKVKCKKWLFILSDALWNYVREMVQDPESQVQEEGLRFLEAMVQTDIGIRAAIDWSNGELLPLIAQKLDTPKYKHLV